VVVGALAAWLVTGFLPKVYEANATLLVGQQLTSVNPGINDLLTSQQLSTAYADLATTRTVRQAVVSKLGLAIDPDALLKVVRVERVGDTSLLDIVAQDASPETAAAIANAVADEIISLSPTLAGQDAEIVTFTSEQLAATKADLQATAAELDALRAKTDRTAAEDQRIGVLQDRLASLRATFVSLLSYAATASPNTVTVIDRAAAPETPASPRLAISLVVGALAGLLLALIVIALREYLQDTIKGREDVERATGLSTLSTVEALATPAKDEVGASLVAATQPGSAAAEAFRMLRTNLGFASVDTGLQSLVVASATPGDGKTLVATNLAIAFAQADRKVILVDSDLRRPSISELFGAKDNYGLTSALQARSEAIEYYLLETDMPGLRILPAGPTPPNPAELIGSDRMGAIIGRLTALADVVIFDSPPLSMVPDGAVLASMVDGTVLVVRTGKTSRTAAQQAMEALVRSAAHVFGVVVNGVEPVRTPSGYGFYRHGSGGRMPPPPRVVPSTGQPVDEVTLADTVERRTPRTLPDDLPIGTVQGLDGQAVASVAASSADAAHGTTDPAATRQLPARRAPTAAPGADTP